MLDENYGRKDAECERRVKAVFEEVGLREKYAEYEEGAYKKIMGLIAEIPEVDPAAGDAPGLKREVFKAFLDKIYKRTK